MAESQFSIAGPSSPSTSHSLLPSEGELQLDDFQGNSFLQEMERKLPKTVAKCLVAAGKLDS